MRTRLFLIAATLVAFGASLVSSFHFDDYAILSDDALTSPSGGREIWTLTQTRPLTYLTFWFNYLTGHDDPLGYHLLNLILHIAVVLLVYECLSRLIGANTAFVAAAIFAIH